MKNDPLLVDEYEFLRDFIFNGKEYWKKFYLAVCVRFNLVVKVLYIITEMLLG